MEIQLDDFQKNYRFLRKTSELVVGDWDLYKRAESNEKLLVKEIQFYDESEARFFIQGVLETSQNHTTRGLLLQLKGYTLKSVHLGGSQTLSAYLFYEYYENTLEKINGMKIVDSESFSPNDLLVLTKRVIRIMATMERLGCRHGDLRLGNIIIPEGKGLEEAQLLWVPFGKRVIEQSLSSKDNLLKVFNFSPETLHGFNVLRRNRDRLNAFRNTEDSIDYPKADVYSLGIMVLRLHFMYTNDSFYDFHGLNGLAKINTKKIEKVVLNLHQINSQLAALLNQCLIYDAKNRASFADLDSRLNSQDANISFTDHLSPNRMRSPNKDQSEMNPNFWTDSNFKVSPPTPENREAQTSNGKQPQANQPRFSNTQSVHRQGTPGTRNKTNYEFLMGSGDKAYRTHHVDMGNSMMSEKPVRDLTTTQKKQMMSIINDNTALVELEDGNLFLEKGLQKFKGLVISKLEKAIFFQKNGNIRKGLKIKEYNSGSKYIGEMFCGKRDGFGLYYYSTGDIYLGQWSLNNPTGTCVFFYSNGSIYLGDLADGEKSGFGRYLYVNGDIYEGEWISNKKHGKGVYSYYRTGDVYEGDWKLDMKGKHGVWYKNGIVYDGKKFFVNQNRRVEKWRDDKFVDYAGRPVPAAD